MQLTPRYGTDPIIEIDGPPEAIFEPVARQRRRLAAVLATFDAERWAHPSRCDAWSNADVIAHLDATNAFWSFSIASGAKGRPTQFLHAFDPVATPAQIVAGASYASNAELLERFTASTEALLDLLASLDADGWRALAEAPAGHISTSALAHHALWDAWIHERDVVLPLGLDQAVEADEVAASLRLVGALGPAFGLTRGDTRSGTLAVEATGPDVAFHVEVTDRASVRSGPAAAADLTLAGDAVDLVDALSIRGPLTQAVPPAAAWLLHGLLQTFDGTPG